MMETVLENAKENEINLKGFYWYPPELVQTPISVCRSAANPKRGMMSIPSQTLMLAGVDISRDLFCRWLLDNEDEGGIFLEIYYERVPGSFKLTRMDPAPTRSIHLNYKLFDQIKDTESFLWMPVGELKLRLMPAKNKVVVRDYIGTASFEISDDDWKKSQKKSSSLLRAPGIEQRRYIVGMSKNCIVLIPDSIYGIQAIQDENGFAVEMKPALKSVRKDFREVLVGEWSCWKGRATVCLRYGVAERDCLVLRRLSKKDSSSTIAPQT